jgi:cholesterol oxidase
VDLENTVDWPRCIACGGCVPGCNHGAKRSLDHTYLTLAERAGVTISSSTEVLDASPIDGGWRVVIAPTGRPRDRETVTTRALVLSAGTFGSLDLLEHMRPSLTLSPAFGQGMSMNGDALAFLYNTRYALGGEHGAPITTTVRLVHLDPDGRPRTLTIMSGRIPAMVSRGSARALALVANVLGPHRGPADGLSRRIGRRIADLRGVREGGALANTLMYKLDGQDAARGRARFEDGRAVMDWEDYTRDPVLVFAAERLRAWADRVGGVLVRDLGTYPLMKSFGVHPLGGCRMGSSFADGVVDDVGRVRTPDGVHRGLWVIDGSIVPTSLGVPPSLTIAALAERASSALVREIAQD